MANATTALVSLSITFALFAAMQLFKTGLTTSKGMTILGGFMGANIFVFLLTAVSSFEMVFFGDSFQTKLVPEVIACLLVAVGASALVHRVCITTCILFSCLLLYYINSISSRRYGHAPQPNVPLHANTGGKKKRN